jgi:ATP-dependent Clp protease ATP-binding subunit ClpA
MAIELMSLFRLASEKFQGKSITLARIVFTWANQDPEKELSTYLDGTGLNSQKLAHCLTPCLKTDPVEDQELLNRVILSDSRNPVTGRELLEAICKTPDSRINRALAGSGADISVLRQNLENDNLKEHHAAPSDNNAEIFLKQYGRELTALALEGEFDHLTDRTKDRERLATVLLKKIKGNAVLTGQAGTGKTALVELLAKKIIQKEVPEQLYDYRVFEISIGKLVSGTRYRGEFEQRLEKLIHSVKTWGKAILFIDEFHLICGAGRTDNSSMDAANLLKPVLARGDVRVIGATTVTEYQHYICKDPALVRRMEEIRLEEPSGQLLTDIVTFQANELSKHHHIDIPEVTIKKAIELADNYMTNRCQPDKSVDLIDTGAVRVACSGGSVLSPKDLLHSLSQITGQALEIMDRNAGSRLRNLSEKLKSKIMGQDKAMDAVAETLIYRHQMSTLEERNLGTFLFTGHTGVGKTETARVLADFYFGNSKKLLHLDMAEYNQTTATHKLVGTPLGFVGCEQEGVLTTFLHTHGHGVILFDEIEKAHPDIHNLLLGILDNGRYRSAKGEVLNTRQCIIILTTNALKPESLKKVSPGFGTSNDIPMPAEMLSSYFPDEFLGRFDEIILFNKLSGQDILNILNLRLKELLKGLNEKIQLQYDRERLLNFLLEKLKKNSAGARGVSRIVEKSVLQPIAIALLEKDCDDAPVIITLDEAFYSTGQIQAYKKQLEAA